MLGIALEDVLTVSYSLVDMALIDQGFDFTVINAQGNFTHRRTPTLSMHQTLIKGKIFL